MKDGDQDRVLEVLVVVTPLFAVDGNGNSSERGVGAGGGDTVYSARDERGRRLEDPAPPSPPPPIVAEERGTTRSKRKLRSSLSANIATAVATTTSHPPIQNVPACGSFQVRAFIKPLITLPYSYVS